MIDRQPTRTIRVKKSSYLSSMEFFSLDTFPGGNIDMISIITDDNDLVDGWISSYSKAFYRAEALYRSVRFVGQVNCFLSWVFNQPTHLLEATEIIPDEITGYHFSGSKLVSINRIIASETCSHDFDFAFNPINDQNRTLWINIAALTFLGVKLPSVNLLQVDNTYIVRDGHYRISAARALGQENIKADIAKLQYPSRKPSGDGFGHV